MTVNLTLACKSLVPGKATGPVLYANVGLSFMGGVDAGDGTVIDTHHPLLGETVAGKVLAIPSGRGSCAGSLVIFELLMNGNAPAAVVFQQKETIITLGAVIAEELFGCGIPIVSLPGDDFNALADAGFARIEDDALEVSDHAFAPEQNRAILQEPDLSRFTLMPRDRSVLAGAAGPAAQAALRIVIRTALLEGVSELVSVEKAHIDGCFYQGPAGLAFARKLQSMGAKVRVPSTMNALCVDRRQWREQGVAPALGVASDDLAEAYVAMGVQPTYTCAPYLLPDPPTFGQQIAWGESNAVAFANSVLGARTLKYPDYLDILVAITGRAPAADCHLDAPRHARVRIDVPPPHDLDDAYFALLGYLVGKLTPNHIPVICGLENEDISHDDLKAFGAAYATTSAVAMFHILGVTPEAATLEQACGRQPLDRRIRLTAEDLRETWNELNTACGGAVGLVSLGNPHFSPSEILRLAELCRGRRKADAVELVVTCGREVYGEAKARGHIDTIEAFGGRFINDTCWCLIGEPIIPQDAECIATNSGKYAHYGPAAVRKGFYFASLVRCVDAAERGTIDTRLPAWAEIETIARKVT